jgi:hypothetical protein
MALLSDPGCGKMMPKAGAQVLHDGPFAPQDVDPRRSKEDFIPPQFPDISAQTVEDPEDFFLGHKRG